MNNKNGKAGIYITACCLAVIAAVIGFAGKRTQKEDIGDSVAEKMPEVQEELAEKEEAKEVEKIEAGIEDDEDREIISVAKAEKTAEVRFTRPVEGKILEEFSENNLIYNEALKDWRTHNGVDLEAEVGTQVLSAANGIVEKITDTNMGKCVEIDHQNGYKTVYANLDEDIQLKKGDEVAEGDVIGLVGNTALGDATEMPHLHFEIIKDGQNINPAEYFE